jgi:hypothetical protein
LARGDDREHIEPAMFTSHLLEQGSHLIGGGMIDTHRNTLPAGGRDQVGRLLDRFRPTSAKTGLQPAATARAVHRRACFPQHSSDTAAGATRGAGDDGDASDQ